MRKTVILYNILWKIHSKLHSFEKRSQTIDIKNHYVCFLATVGYNDEFNRFYTRSKHQIKHEKLI